MMSSSLENVSLDYQYLHPPPHQTPNPLSSRSQESLLPRQGCSPNFLACLKGLMHHPGSPSRPRTSNVEIYDNSSTRDSSFATHLRIVSSADNRASSSRPSGLTRRKRREPVPSMIDYLTLSQLETVWQKQDTYKGCVDAPQRAPEQSTILASQQSGTNLQIPYMDVHPVSQRRHPHGDLARSRRAAASSTTNHRR